MLVALDVVAALAVGAALVGHGQTAVFGAMGVVFAPICVVLFVGGRRWHATSRMKVQGSRGRRLLAEMLMGLGGFGFLGALVARGDHMTDATASFAGTCFYFGCVCMSAGLGVFQGALDAERQGIR